MVKRAGNTKGAAGSDLVALTADIASAYVANNAVHSGELAKVIETIHTSLKSLGEPKAAPAPARREPPISIKKSVTPDAIISMEDGKPYKSLKRHLRGQGLSPQEYKEKWGLPHDYPMVASSYAAKRSELAKSIGLGRKKKVAPEPAPALARRRHAARRSKRKDQAFRRRSSTRLNRPRWPASKRKSPDPHERAGAKSGRRRAIVCARDEARRG